VQVQLSAKFIEHGNNYIDGRSTYLSPSKERPVLCANAKGVASGAVLGIGGGQAGGKGGGNCRLHSDLEAKGLPMVQKSPYHRRPENGRIEAQGRDPRRHAIR